MANRLSMATIHSIQTLYQSGHSNREIARLLAIDRGAVNAYVRRLQAASGEQRAALAEVNPPTGSAPSGAPQDQLHPPAPDQNRPNPHTGSPSRISGAESVPGSGATVDRPPVCSGPPSLCQAYRETIERKLDQGLSITRIHQDLKAEHGFAGSYHAVRRYLLRLGRHTPLPFRRMECEPGEEAQIDFGTGAWVVDYRGTRRRPWMFRIVLSHSRKAYSEVVWRQTSDQFIAAIENAFHHFGGVPKRLVIDNLKAAVKRADWYDPEVHPKLQSFAVHYGTAFVPTRPYTPEHKGKVESAVKYAKNNGLKGHTFGSLAEQNAHDEAFEGHERILNRYLKPDLLILDDMGMKQLPKRSGEFLFEIILRRHELRSTIMTSNRPLEDWGKLIGDVPAATAILDRFLQDAELIQITGRSYRLRGRVADRSEDQSAVEPATPSSAPPATDASKTGQTRTPGRPQTSTHTTSK